METRLRKIGNSRGVIIPAQLIERLRLSDTVELSVENEALVMRSTTPQRQGWFDNYDPEQDDMPLEGFIDDADDQADWEW